MAKNSLGEQLNDDFIYSRKLILFSSPVLLDFSLARHRETLNSTENQILSAAENTS